MERWPNYGTAAMRRLRRRANGFSTASKEARLIALACCKPPEGYARLELATAGEQSGGVRQATACEVDRARKRAASRKRAQNLGYRTNGWRPIHAETTP